MTPFVGTEYRPYYIGRWVRPKEHTHEARKRERLGCHAKVTQTYAAPQNLRKHENTHYDSEPGSNIKLRGCRARCRIQRGMPRRTNRRRKRVPGAGAGIDCAETHVPAGNKVMAVADLVLDDHHHHLSLW